MPKQLSQQTKDAIVALDRAGVKQDDIRKQLDLSWGTVNKYVHQGRSLRVPGLNGGLKAVTLPPEQFVELGRASEASAIAAGIQQDSLKTRMMRAIAEQGPFAGVPELINAIRSGPKDQSFGGHEVTHILYSLNKQGCIAFRTSRKGSPASLIQDIRATSAGYASAGVPVPGKGQEGRYGGRAVGTSRPGHAVGKDMTEQRHHGTKAEGGPITRDKASPILDAQRLSSPAGFFQPKPEAPQPRTNEEPPALRLWPQLQELRDRQAAMAAVAHRADALLEAAALLDGIDPDESRRLLERASALTSEGMTAAEAEYLEFAEGRA